MINLKSQLDIVNLNSLIFFRKIFSQRVNDNLRFKWIVIIIENNKEFSQLIKLFNEKLLY